MERLPTRKAVRSIAYLTTRVIICGMSAMKPEKRVTHVYGIALFISCAFTSEQMNSLRALFAHFNVPRGASNSVDNFHTSQLS